MAEKPYTLLAGFPESAADDTHVVYLWEGLAGGDTGAPLELPEFNNKTIQIRGSFGGSNCTIQGNLIPDSTVYVSLTNASGAFTSSAATVRKVVEEVVNIRPAMAASTTSVDVDVYLLASR